MEGQVSVLVLQYWHDLAGVQAPPVQQEGGMCGGLVHAPTNLFGFGVIREVPGFGLPQEMDHFGIATVSGRNARIDLFFRFFLKTNAYRERNSWKVLVQRRPFVSFTATFGNLLLFAVSCWCNIRIMSPPCGRPRNVFLFFFGGSEALLLLQNLCQRLSKISKIIFDCHPVLLVQLTGIHLAFPFKNN